MDSVRSPGVLEWIFTFVAFLVIGVAALLLYYISVPVDADGMGRYAFTVLSRPGLTIFPAVICLVFLIIALIRKWFLATLGYLVLLILVLYLMLWPSLTLKKAAKSWNVPVSIGQALSYQFNTANAAGIMTIKYGIPADSSDLLMDYWPSIKKDTGFRPVIVKVHGGGWVAGSRKELTAWNRWFNELGYDVFDLDYRLPPPERWQDQTGDIKSAIGWLVNNAQQFRIDTGRIIMMGNSAGASLALLAAYSYNDFRLPPSCDVPHARVRAVVDIYGPSDMAMLYATTGSTSLANYGLQRYIGGAPVDFRERYDMVSPVAHVTPSSPATLIIHGEKDRIVPVTQSLILANALKKAGVPYEFYSLPYTDHSFDFNWNSIASQIAREEISQFLEKVNNQKSIGN
ncbi:alpha/beta hydrolase [Flavihumibacter solisilvae]|uniref:alpha/beta hydrolase n=1 Tax=Flavihumibacter solisilvae TaxID=1349421 RepID=UPI000B227A45|nr:alpha/beta hydrolase [Flavihumibacter solisilvae]